MTQKSMPGLSIPSDFPLQAFIGHEFSQLCIGRHQLRLNFIGRCADVPAEGPDGFDAEIYVEAGFKLVINSGDIFSGNNADLASGAAGFTHILGQTVTAVERLPNNELSLHFDDGAELVLLVDLLGFESYQLNIAGHSVDVTKEW